MSQALDSHNTRILMIFAIIFFCAFFFLIIMLIGRNQLAELLFIPMLTPEEWLEIQPWIQVDFFSVVILIMQPSSSFFVYSLVIISMVFGITLSKQKKKDYAKIYWGIALILWGLGALAAGTSYQAFSYAIKCADRDFCLWTSWWEILYLILSVSSVNAMMIAQSYSCATGKKQQWMQIIAFSSSAIYSVILGVGVAIPIRFLISFELLVIFLAPNIVFFLILNIQRYIREKNQMDLHLIKVWCFLGAVMGLYFFYSLMGFTELLWMKGIWISDNDLLHIGLILWMIYVRNVVIKYVHE